MKKRFAVGVAWLLACGGFASAAQQAGVPTLQVILSGLEANLAAYDRDVPSFFCDERVVSAVEPSAGERQTVTESVFRLTRAVNADHTRALKESREIKSVNGKPASSKDIEGPSLLSGAFEGGLAVVSLEQAACMKYKLERGRPGQAYVVRFATALTPQNSAGCLLQEKSSGRVLIDPATMQITHFELRTPHHAIIPGQWHPVVGERVVTVDYAPVVLDDKTFWMPSTIAMRSTGDAGTFHQTVWTFRATYSNYHKLEVKSRILPGTTLAR